MVTSMKKQVTVPPYWVDYLFGFACIGIYFWNPDASRVGGISPSKVLLIMGLLIILKASIHYSIGNKGILVRIIGIPIRLIKWNQVSTAEYIYEWNNGAKCGGSVKGQGIFVTLHNCPCFSPEVDGLDMFVLHHPFSCLFIRFTSRSQEKFVELFQLYYPALSFQIGYEKNLYGKK